MALVDPNDPVAKGPVTYCLDTLSTGGDAGTKLSTLRQAIIEHGAINPDYDGLESVFAEHLFAGFYNPDQIAKLSAYLGQCWFNVETGWWPAFQPVAPIYAVGMLKALNASLGAGGTPKPIDSYWIVGHSQVELMTLESAYQVTWLIATPPPIEYGPHGVIGESAQAWVTARRAGVSEHEVDPVMGDQVVAGGTERRLRTFKVRTPKMKE